MTVIAAPLGILACLSIAGMAYGSVIPGAHEDICYGGRDVPKRQPEQPAGCHAVFACAEHRKHR
jgi:hypothetical protein